MATISIKHLLLVLGFATGLSLVACRSTDSANASQSGTVAAAAAMTPQTEPEATKVLKEYHQALIAGDSVKARSLATGTTLAILEYRFFRSNADDNMQFTYGSQNILRDTCYIPLRVRNASTRDPEKQGKAILVKVDGKWKVERIAMQK